MRYNEFRVECQISYIPTIILLRFNDNLKQLNCSEG
jgi:hypothetical protein